jgi:hypothetical protein
LVCTDILKPGQIGISQIGATIGSATNNCEQRSRRHELLKADIVFQPHSIRDAAIKTALNPVKNLNEVIVGFSGELQIGPAVVEFDRLGQLCTLIDDLNELRDLWHEKQAAIVRLPL